MTGWAEVEAALNGILDRRWYTNHGPLAQLLEAECAEAAGVRHAIAATNPTIGLIMVADALGLSGQVILSPLAPPRCSQALIWAGLEPLFADIDPNTLGLDLAAAGTAAGSRTSALLGTPCTDPAGAEALTTALGLRLFADGLPGHAGPVLMDLPTLGDDAGSACILTDEDVLAARLRNIRSSYGAGSPVPVVRTANGRLSEAQAAMGLLGPLGWNAAAAQLGPVRAMFPGRQVIRYGRDILVVAKDASDRDALCQEPHSRPFVLDSRAVRCPVAASIASRALVLNPAKFAKGPR
jgi:hypothetical protein